MLRSFSAPVGLADPYLQRSLSSPVGLVDPYLAGPYDAWGAPGFAPTAAHAASWARRARFAPLAPLPEPPLFMDYTRRFEPYWARDDAAARLDPAPDAGGGGADEPLEDQLATLLKDQWNSLDEVN